MRSLGFRSPQRDLQLTAALQRVRQLTRDRFDLLEDEAVFAVQAECKRAGCPPLQTVVVFWTMDQTRRYFRVLKAAPEVEIEDLPPKWLIEALGPDEQEDSTCC